MSFFLEVVQSAFSPMVLFYMFAGVAAGICIGALPGLTATMGVALLLPLTFGMDATSGILMLLGIYVGAIYGGSISAILLHTPGTPASAATAIDGYQFSKRGEAGRALGIATLSLHRRRCELSLLMAYQPAARKTCVKIQFCRVLFTRSIRSLHYRQYLR